MIYSWLLEHLMTSLFDLDDQSLGSQEIFKVLTFPSFTLSAANKLQQFFVQDVVFVFWYLQLNSVYIQQCKQRYHIGILIYPTPI